MYIGIKIQYYDRTVKYVDIPTSNLKYILHTFKLFKIFIDYLLLEVVKEER